MGIIEKADRIKQLPPYLFRDLDRQKAEVVAKGVDVIDLGVGDPDLPTPPHIVQALKDAADNPENHQYPSYIGMLSFRKAVADWYMRRFDVSLDPEKEIVTLIGSKEGVAHVPFAFINPGDIALVPSPAYPVYYNTTLFAGGEPYIMPLVKENNFLPDLEKIPEQIAQRAKLLFLNYPNNPTSAITDINFFDKVVEFARRFKILVCHDAAYTEMAYNGYMPPSFLQADGAKDVAIETHSLSKTYNMTGFRIGFAVGNQLGIDGLGQIKSNIDSGAFQAVQYAGIKALEGDQSCVDEMIAVYTERRNIMVKGLQDAGFDIQPPKATFYLWIAVPEGFKSTEFASKLLKQVGVLVTPGVGFGAPGEGYFRISLTKNTARLKEAVERIKKIQ